jgi:beta-galactosidase
MFPFGVTYYPDQWPKESWDETFAEIKKAGLNIVRFGEMAWDWIEPEPGKFTFSELDEALDLCAKHGIKVLLGIPTSQVPTWFFRLYPDSRPVAQDGTLYPEYGPRPNICKDNPNYRKHAEAMAKKLVSRYKNHPALLFWQLDNEPVYPPLDHTTSNDFCHCPHSRQEFINWAQQKYGTIEKLNKIWGANFWTTSFASFDDIMTPKAGIWEAVSPHIFLDWFRFKSDRIKEWITHLAKITRQIDKQHKVGTNGFVGICTRVPDHSQIADNLDFYGLDVYPQGGRMKELDLAFTYDLWRSFCRATGAEFHITELQGGQNVRWGYPGYVKGPEIKWWTELALVHGAKALLYHNWKPPMFGAETAGFGILASDGSPTKRLRVIEALAKNVAATFRSPKNGGLKTAATKIAIAYLRGSEIQTYQEQGPPRAIAGQWETVRTDIGLMYSISSISAAYAAAYKKGKPVDFIFERDLDSGKLPYKTILLPNPYLLSKKQYFNLVNWVKNGGTLITEARFGLKDQHCHLYPTPLMNELFGVEYEYTESTTAGFIDGLKNEPKKPQFFTKKFGHGKAVYANFSLFLEIKKGNKKWLGRLRKEIGK